MTAIPFWPGNVNQYVIRGTLNVQPVRNVREFKPESGPPMGHRISSISVAQMSWNMRGTDAELDALDDFYLNALQDGVLKFVRNDPRSGAKRVFQFTAAPATIDQRQTKWHMAIAVLRLPDAVPAGPPGLDFSKPGNSQNTILGMT